MDAGMMKVVFSSMMNRTAGDLSANKAARCETGAADKADKKEVLKPNIRFSEPKAEADDFKEKTSQEVFTSLVNASSCANLQTEKALDGYLTFTPEGAFLREYLK